MTKEKKEELRNHIPTVKKLCDVFLRCLDCPENIDDEIEKNYLIEVIDKIEIQTSEARDILNS